MIRNSQTEQTFTIISVPYQRYIITTLGFSISGFLLAWDLFGWLINGKLPDSFTFIFLIAVFITSVFYFTRTRSRKLIIDRSQSNVYLVRSLGIFRKVEHFGFEQISTGLYVRADETTASSNSFKANFVYSLWLRLKFEQDIMIGDKSPNEWKTYNDAAYEANKYFGLEETK